MRRESQEWDVEWLKFKEAVDDKNLRKEDTPNF